MEYKIRKAQPGDITEIIQLCAEHAEYERAEYSAEGKAERLSANLFSESPAVHCLIAEGKEGVLGYATYMFEYSTWDADRYVYMDCLYLRAPYRGYGIGEALVKEIASQANLNQIDVVQWHTPSFNTRAIKFYHRIGADSREKVRFYLKEQAIQDLIGDS